MVKGKSWVNWCVMIQYLYHPTWFTGPYHDVYDNWHSTILNQTGITGFKGCGPSANVIYFEIPTALFLFIIFEPLIAFHVAMCVNGWLLIINELCQMYFRYSAIDKNTWMIVIDRNESHFIRYHIYIYIYICLWTWDLSVVVMCCVEFGSTIRLLCIAPFAGNILKEKLYGLLVRFYRVWYFSRLSYNYFWYVLIHQFIYIYIWFSV